MTTLLLVDYPIPVRRALRTRLSLESDLEIIGEADDAAEAVCSTRRLGPSVVLVDAETPDLDTAALVRALADSSRRPGIVVLTQHSSSLKHLLNGTSAVVVGKHEGSRRLVDAIRSVATCARSSGQARRRRRSSDK